MYSSNHTEPSQERHALADEIEQFLQGTLASFELALHIEACPMCWEKAESGLLALDAEPNTEGLATSLNFEKLSRAGLMAAEAELRASVSQAASRHLQSVSQTKKDESVRVRKEANASELLESENWEERLKGARLASEVNDEKLIPRLSDLLIKKDESVRVRKEAERALGFADVDHVQRLRQVAPGYLKAAAREVLARYQRDYPNLQAMSIQVANYNGQALAQAQAAAAQGLRVEPLPGVLTCWIQEGKISCTARIPLFNEVEVTWTGATKPSLRRLELQRDLAEGGAQDVWRATFDIPDKDQPLAIRFRLPFALEMLYGEAETQDG